MVIEAGGLFADCPPRGWVMGEAIFPLPRLSPPFDTCKWDLPISRETRGPGWSRTPRLCPVESPVPPQPPSGYLDPGRSIRAAGRPGRRLGATLLEGETVADVS